MFLKPSREDIVDFDSSLPPYLLIIIDAEEEFEWTKFSSSSTSVRTIRKQILAQRIFERYGIVPTYAVDYPVASQEEGFKPLKEFLDSGVCEIGAQLHPWVNPPIREEIVRRNTYPGNLDRQLEFDKLKTLTEIISQNFDFRPIIYRAGRYGLGPYSSEILEELKYEIDCSVLPGADLRQSGGPDYRLCNVAKPFWTGPGRSVLELPVTAGYTGLFHRSGPQLHSLATRPATAPYRLPGILSRGGLLDSIRLSPEGIPLADAKHLTRALLRRGNHRVFSLSYHSPSLEVGNTPYVRDAKDLDNFLGWIEGYLDFFFGELGGRPATPGAIRQAALERRADAVRTARAPAWGIVGVARPPLEPASDPELRATVSVVIPAYNSEQFLARAIDSALHQTVTPLEVLVVDDGSSDRTAEVAEAFGAPVRVLRRVNGGPAAARNQGAAEARGEWLAFLDADDLWKESKLARQLTVAAAEQADLVQSMIPVYRIVPRRIDFTRLWAGNCIATSSVLLRRSVFEAVGGFDEERALIGAEDYNLWLRIAARGYSMVSCLEELTIYSRTGGLSSQVLQVMRGSLKNVEKLAALLNLPAEQVRQKECDILETAGMTYLYQRQMSGARSSLWQALRADPTLRRTALFSLSMLPAAILDARRRLLDSLRSRDDGFKSSIEVRE